MGWQWVVFSSSLMSWRAALSCAASDAAAMHLTDRPLPAALAFCDHTHNQTHKSDSQSEYSGSNPEPPPDPIATWEGAARRLTRRRAAEDEDEEGKKAELDGPARRADGEGRAGAAAAAARRSAMVVAGLVRVWLDRGPWDFGLCSK
jgi:hypothetical protein